MFKRSATTQNYGGVFYTSLAIFCSQFSSSGNSRGIYNASTTSPDNNETVQRSLVSFCSHLNNSAIAEGIFEVSAASPKNYNEVIYRSLMSFCSQSNPSGNKTGPNRSNDLNNSYITFQWNWTGPDIFPVHVHANRSGDTVFASFTIVHTGPAFAFRSESFQFRKIPIKYPPRASGAVQSPLSMMINGAECRNAVPVPDVPIKYAFYLKKKSASRVYLTINVCQFETIWGKVYEGGQQRYQIRSFVQNVSQPFFKINSGKGPDEIFIKKYENASVDVEVNMTIWDTLFINVYMWERGLKWLIYDSIEFRLVENDENVTLKIMHSNEADSHREDLLNMEILRDGPQPLVRITVNTAGIKRTGQLDLTYHRRETKPYVLFPFIRYMEITRTITLRHRCCKKVFPRNKVLIHKDLPFKCDHHGNMNHPKQDLNCTIRCRAFGRSIKSILIEKVKMAGAERVVTPVQKVSYVVGKEAFAMVDMGPVSSDIRGKYQCQVQMANGAWKKQDIMLHTETRYIPNITHVSLDVFTNRTIGMQFANFSCTIYSVKPVDVSFFVSKEATNVWNIYDLDGIPADVTASVHHIQTTNLTYPAKYLTCLVSDKTHNDKASIWLYNQNFRYYPEPPVIDRHPNASYMSASDNGTLKVVCSVISEPYIDVTITLSRLLFEVGTTKEADLSKLPGALRNLEETWTRTTLTVIIPGNDLKEDYRNIDCLAARGMNQMDIMTLSRAMRLDDDRQLL